MNTDLLKEEASDILIGFGNKVLYAGALGKKEYPSLLNDQMRLHTLFSILKNIERPLSQEVKTIKYGYLYNYFAMANICTDKAHLPSMQEWNTLIDYLGGYEVAGGKLKEEGTTFWNSPNTDATNEVGFNAKGSGMRVAVSNTYGVLGESTFFATSTLSGGLWSGLSLSYNYAFTSTGNNDKRTGYSVRLIVDTPVDVMGNTAIYEGNDGHRYNCVKIGNQWWLAENLIETLYNDGTAIGTDWSVLSTGAYGYYDTLSNAYESSYVGGTEYYLGDTLVDSTFVLSLIETIRHYRKAVIDLSTIYEEDTPATPTPDPPQDIIRTGSQVATLGANIVVFSSPLPSNDYIVTAWVVGDGESQLNLGTIIKGENGFSTADVLIEGTLNYQAIMRI